MIKHYIVKINFAYFRFIYIALITEFVVKGNKKY